MRRTDAYLAGLILILASSACATETDGEPPSAAELRALTSSCSHLSGMPPFATDVNSSGAPDGSGTVELCSLSGAIWWQADLDIDCDGGKQPTCLDDDSYLPDTATTDAQGAPLDASTVPYVVVPLPWQPEGPRSADFFYCDHGLALGGVVAVVYGDEVAYGVIGDEGPVTAEPSGADGECSSAPLAGGVIGEASFARADALGIDPDPNSGGVDCDTGDCPVTYILFTGDALSDPGDTDAARDEGSWRARALISAQ